MFETINPTDDIANIKEITNYHINKDPLSSDIW
jgi:hypothetical protein